MALLKKAVLCVLLTVAILGAVAAALPSFQPEREEPSTAHAQRTAELGLMLLDEDNGLFVLAITEYSPAWRAGFQAGDLLLFSGDTPLTSVLQLEAMISFMALETVLSVESRRSRESLIFSSHFSTSFSLMASFSSSVSGS